MESIEGRLDARLLACVVLPVNRNLVTGLCAAYPKIDKWIFRYGLTPLRVHHGLAIVRGDDASNEMQRYDFTGNGILAQPCLHRVEHQHLYVGHIALQLGADFHCISHPGIIPDCLPASTAAAADRHFYYLVGDEQLAGDLDDSPDLGRYAHLDPRGHERFDAVA